MSNDHALITGGAGFIGSHLAERLVRGGDSVTVVDDLSHGERTWMPEETTFVNGDLTERETAESALTDTIDIVYHLAASKVVNSPNPRRQFEENSRMTYNLLERMADVGVSKIVFTSSSTVYGEAPNPTPEDFGPLEPISVYGASKLADEGLLSATAHSNDLTVWNFRFANIIGPRLRGAVIPDFIEKLSTNPDRLQILGDGRQEKSYMYVSDCINAMLHVIDRTGDPVNTFNLGTGTTTSVNQIADIVSDVMGLDPRYEYTGTERGWPGDVRRMRLSTEKLLATGWEPDQSSDEAVERAARRLVGEI